MSPLHVYRASAGSGKTHELSLRYLEQLLLNPQAYRHILAITFTNKAAGEMKQRVLSQLHDLSAWIPGTESGTMKKLEELTGQKPEEIARASAGLLQAILNDYGAFSVGTIDRFFQSVIRAFVREIGIQPGYNLEMDNDRVLDLAIEGMFRKLDQDSELENWLVRFAEEKLEWSQNWNFRHELAALGGQLFQESFQMRFPDGNMSSLSRAHLRAFGEKLKRIREEGVKEMGRIGREALSRMTEEGLEPTSFKGASKSPASLFQDAAEGREIGFTSSRKEGLFSEDKWLKKGADASIQAFCRDKLMPLYRDLYDAQVLLNSTGLIRKHFYSLGILEDLQRAIQEYTKEKNLFLLSDASRFLKGIIGSNQLPFVFERTGNRYTRLMLDEFQDTSRFQYENLKALLDNALAAGEFSLVVGDLKQSIFRWRNSDWKILGKELLPDFRHQERHSHTLERNYRSREMLVRFNNTVFQLAPRRLALKIAEEAADLIQSPKKKQNPGRSILLAYADAVQQLRPGRNEDYEGGLVHIDLIEEEEEQTFTEQALSRIPEWVDEVMSCGVLPGEIAILVRDRKEGSLVARSLLEAEAKKPNAAYPFISNQSLLLAANDAVCLLVAGMAYLQRPGDRLNNARLKNLLFSLECIRDVDQESLLDADNEPARFLPEEFGKLKAEYRQLPLYELSESLIQLFSLHQRTQDLPYLQAFLDLILDLGRRDHYTIHRFLHYWEQHGTSHSIVAGEEADAIRILTIHKAKGLEFEALLLPFCNWEISTTGQKSNLLWCSTEGTPFTGLPCLPLAYGDALKDSKFAEDYFRERVQGYMDNLNLLYVAFTRARSLLYAAMPRRNSNELKSVADLFQELLQEVPERGPSLDPLSNYQEEGKIRIGGLPVYSRGNTRQEEAHINSHPLRPVHQLPAIRLRSDAYFMDPSGDEGREQAYGSMMHQLFAAIDVREDLEPVLDRYYQQGLIDKDEWNELYARISEMMDEKPEWFDRQSGWQVYTERTIVAGGSSYRPDRVMIAADRLVVVDYKFGKEKAAHKAQLRQYIHLLKSMGHSHVQGCLWYPGLHKIEELS